LPEEIGNLSNLKSLYLYGSMITSLPSSIGRLQNLELLDLHNTDNLSELPEEIGDLTRLRDFDLKESAVTSFPLTFRRFTGLRRVDFYNSCFWKLQDLEDESKKRKFLLNIVQDCRFLGSLGSRIDNKIRDEDNEELQYKLAYNRARLRMESVVSKLWPHVLKSGTRAFEPYNDYYFELFDDENKLDAMYRLLVDFRESFVGVLLNRNA
jgi:hypothetical protein